MPEHTTLTLHISREIMDDSATLLRIGATLFRLYEKKGIALIRVRGREHRRLSPEDAAGIFRLMGEVEALAGRWSES